MNSPKKTARTAGFLYLLLGLTGMFGLMYVPSQIIVAGDAAATVDNIRNAELLYRLGIVGNLLCQILFVYLVLALNRLLKRVNEQHAKLMVTLVIVSVPIAFLNMLNLIAALVLLSGAEFLAVFEAEQLNALVMVFINLYEQGIVIVEIFWGLWLFPFGLLVYKSGFIPKILGVLLMIACVGYLANSFSALLVPELRGLVSMFTSITGTVGEFSILLWLLIMGVKNQPRLTPASAH